LKAIKPFDEMKKFPGILLICLFCCYVNAQNAYTDSLKTALANTNDPIKKFDIVNRQLEYDYISGEGNPDSSRCIDLLRIAKQLNSDSLLGIAYNQAGNFFFRDKGDFARAIEYFFKGIPFAEAIWDKRRLSSLYIDIAAVYARLNNAEEEIKYIHKAIANLPERTSPLYYFVAAQAYYYMSAYYLSRGQMDSTLHYAQELSDANLSLKSPMFESATHGLMGIVYESKGDKALAELHMAKSNSLSDSIQYLFGKIEAKFGYINYLVRNHRMVEAKQQATLLMNIGIEKNNYDVKKTAAGFLTTVYDNNHQADSAFYYSRLESAMKDSIFNQSNLNKIQGLAFNEQLRNVEEESKRIAEAKQRTQNLQYALIALGIISFIISFLLLSRRHITNTKMIRFLGIVALLLVFEFLNLLLHPFLERITHHSPILMLLALVCIAALLVPLHHRMEEWAIHKLVEKNKQARLRAAKKTIEQLGNQTN
jgi:tetratricopeptide (TPR) repeat protein